MKNEDKESDAVHQMLDKIKPYAAKLTFGSIVGYCSGAAARKIGKALAVLGGLAFIAIQSGMFFLQTRAIFDHLWMCEGHY
jgi:hypothetical protein